MGHSGTPASWTEEIPVERSTNPITVPRNRLNPFLSSLVNQRSAVRVCEMRRSRPFTGEQVGCSPDQLSNDGDVTVPIFG
jgi:hypothetical protein